MRVYVRFIFQLDQELQEEDFVEQNKKDWYVMWWEQHMNRSCNSEEWKRNDFDYGIR